ncbi:unnamed protein product [Discosporangium mesarthrocarpum]
MYVDEKWFYIVTDSARINLRSDEEVPNPPRSPSKPFISKVMCLIAVARPWQLSNGAWFDGKTSIWPVTETVKGSAAARSVLLVTWKSNLSPRTGNTIKARMPGASTHTIWVQQDSAKPIFPNWTIEATPGGNIILETQPPNSPHLCS